MRTPKSTSKHRRVEVRVAVGRRKKRDSTTRCLVQAIRPSPAFVSCGDARAQFHIRRFSQEAIVGNSETVSLPLRALECPATETEMEAERKLEKDRRRNHQPHWTKRMTDPPAHEVGGTMSPWVAAGFSRQATPILEETVHRTNDSWDESPYFETSAHITGRRVCGKST